MCEMIAFGMCLESSEQPEVRQHQIRAVGRVWNNFKSDAFCCCWNGSTSVGSVSMKHRFPPPHVHNLFVVSASLESSHKSWSWFLHLWPCNPLCSPRTLEHALSSGRLVLGFFYFWEEWGDDIEMTGFSNPGCSCAPNTHPPWHCCTKDHYCDFYSERVIADILTVLLSSFCA